MTDTHSEVAAGVTVKVVTCPPLLVLPTADPGGRLPAAVRDVGPCGQQTGAQSAGRRPAGEQPVLREWAGREPANPGGRSGLRRGRAQILGYCRIELNTFINPEISIITATL